MSDGTLSQELEGKPVIGMTDGNIVAKLEDVLIDPETCQIAALVTSRGGLLKREIKAILGTDVHVWGRDAVLVRRADVVVEEEQVPGIEKWLSVVHDLKGREVVDTCGVRIGVLGDVIIAPQGQIMGYDLSQVFVKGPVAYSRQVPAEATRSLGRDALIVDATQIEG